MPRSQPNVSLVDRQGLALAELIFIRDLQWIFREQLVKDVGIDAIVEIVSSGSATGKLIAVQIKSGESYFSESTADGLIFRSDSQHLEYWLRYPMPVLVVLCRPSQNRCWWQIIDSHRVTLTGRGWKTLVPFTNELGPTSADSIRAQVHAWRAQRQERDRPMEDEFSVILQWLGGCRLVHKLHQFAFPPGPSQRFSIPALVAGFEVDDTTIPVLIDVADWSSGGMPSWEPSYVDSLQRYANLLSMPLLIA